MSGGGGDAAGASGEPLPSVRASRPSGEERRAGHSAETPVYGIGVGAGVPSVSARGVGFMNDNEEYVREFLVESAENLDQLDQDLVALEENPRDSQRLASIFRTVHTIKGTSGFFGFAKLGAITHSGEHLLGQLRDGKIDLDDDVTGVLLTLVDAVRSILERIEKTGGEGESDFHDLSQSLDRVAFEAAKRRENGGVVITRLTPPPPESPPDPAAPTAIEEPVPADPETTPAAVPVTIEAPVAAEERVTAEAPELPAVPIAPAIVPAITMIAEVEADTVPLSTAQVVAPEAVTAAAPPSPAQPPAARVRRPAVSEQSIRVDVGLLGTLVDLVGELVLARNQLESTVRHKTATRGDDHPELLKVVHRIDTVTASLQAAADEDTDAADRAGVQQVSPYRSATLP
jgi:two-component system, chemotaxis family, sensor kinase CheA